MGDPSISVSKGGVRRPLTSVDPMVVLAVVMVGVGAGAIFLRLAVWFFGGVVAVRTISEWRFWGYEGRAERTSREKVI